MMSSTTLPPPARLSLFLVTLLVFTGLVVSVGTPTAAAKPCWERVIDEWINNGRIVARYSPACLRASLEHVPEDVRAYSDFEEKIKQAIQESLRFRRLEMSEGAAATTRAQERQVERLENEERTAAERREESPIERALRYRNEDASSIPLPLIVLAGLALVLMTAGAAGIAQRKLQARKARSR